MRSLLLVLVLGLLAGGCARESGDRSETVAVVNGRPISLAQYQRSYREYLASAGLPDEPTRRSAFLNRLIAVELISAEARDQGIEETEAFVEARERARQKLLIEAYLEDEVYSRIEVTEQDLVDQFVRVNTQMTARHLYARTLEEAQALYLRLEAGEEFEAIASEIFDDPVLSESGGLVGTFGFDEMDPAFEDEAFRLRVGQTSRPIRTSQGWSIIRLEDRFTKPIMTESEFAERKDNLNVYVRERKENKARREFLESLVDGAQVQINEAVAQQVIGTSLEQPEGESETLVTFRVDGREETWSQADLMEASRYTSDRQRRSVDDLHDLRAFVEGLVARRVVLVRAQDGGLGRDDRVRQGLDGAMAEWIYEESFNGLVSGMELADEDLKAYYEQYRGEYTVPQKALLREIVTADRAQAEALKAQAGTTSFSELARRHSLRPESASGGGDLGALSAEDLGPWAEQVFTARPGSVLGPLPAAGKFLLLQVVGFEPERPASFEEARAQVEAQLRRERQQDFLRDHVQQLRNRYPVRIVIDSLDEVPISGTAHA